MGLSQADWEACRTLMSGPSGLWYPHLAPAMVLGINARTDGERQRFARMVWERERQRLDALFAFSRSYQQVVRTERSRPGFSFFEETLLQPPPQDLARSGPDTGRIAAFVSPDCPTCDSGIRDLVASGRPFDVYVTDAGTDREIRLWARRAGIPPDRVVSRSITLNHASRSLLARTGYWPRDLPLFLAGSPDGTPVSLQSLPEGTRSTEPCRPCFWP